MKKLRIIVGGFAGLLPAGGVSWDYIQYPLGLYLMGHDVYYIEDTRMFPVYQEEGYNWNDATPCVAKLRALMQSFQMNDRWAYRDEASGNCFGMEYGRIMELCASADVFINISCSTFLRDEYLKIPTRVLIDSDPMFTQIQILSDQKFTPGKTSMEEFVKGHNHFFSFGENIGSADCLIPDCGLHWKKTRQPVCLSYWQNQLTNDSNEDLLFTTIMNWTAGKNLNYNGDLWGQKDQEFSKIKMLPKLFSEADFAIVVKLGETNLNADRAGDLNSLGWKLVDPQQVAANWSDYRKYIWNSSAEFSVAKQTYVKSVSGWFSCRSACYLAAGKPVVTQETGWSRYIPEGRGLFAFSNLEEILEALEQIGSAYKLQSTAAGEIARNYFDSTIVLTDLLNQI